MKKLFLLFAFALTAVSGFAQKGTIELGARLNYSPDKPHAGIGVVGRYQLDRHFRPELTANFYPAEDGVRSWDLNANLHYVFDITDRFKLYPLGGVGLVNVHADLVTVDVDDLRSGFNLGGGLQFNITRDLRLTAESYYQFVSDVDRAVLNVGLVYAF